MQLERSSLHRIADNPTPDDSYIMVCEMNKTWFKAHRVFVTALLVTIIHFVLTSIIWHYISIQIGTQVGQVVSQGFIEVLEKGRQNLQQSEAEEEATKIGQDMKNKSDQIVKKWDIPIFVISLPVKPLINPFLTNLRHFRIKRVLSKEMSKEQFYTWGIMIDYATYFVNSFCVGLLIYMILRIMRHSKIENITKHSHRPRTSLT